jgi:hypothetical protein
MKVRTKHESKKEWGRNCKKQIKSIIHPTQKKIQKLGPNLRDEKLQDKLKKNILIRSDFFK